MAQTTNKLMAIIENHFKEMRKYHEKTFDKPEGWGIIPNKRRARKASMKLTNALKDYRAISNNESNSEPPQDANGKKFS